MAKLCMKIRDLKRSQLVAKKETKRRELRELIKKEQTEFETKKELMAKLNNMPRNTSRIRIRNRCMVCGRARGVYSRFGLCRIHLREAMMRGEIPGLEKASW
jgi:small subunit ribosomal protein S14